MRIFFWQGPRPTYGETWTNNWLAAGLVLLAGLAGGWLAALGAWVGLGLVLSGGLRIGPFTCSCWGWWRVLWYSPGERYGVFRDKPGVIPGRWGGHVWGFEFGSRQPGAWPWAARLQRRVLP